MPEVMAVGLDVLSKVKVPKPPAGMALPVLLANCTELAKEVEEPQPDGAVMLVGVEGRSKLPCIQPYQKALIATVPVLSRVNEYSNSLPDVPVSVSVAVAERVPWPWRLPTANPPATIRAKQNLIFIKFGLP